MFISGVSMPGRVQAADLERLSQVVSPRRTDALERLLAADGPDRLLEALLESAPSLHFCAL
jgi:hypothetical protein